MKILITGAGGFLGSRLCEYLKRKGYDVYGLFHNVCDITDEEQVEKVMIVIRPDIVIHCAAVSDVSTCDKNKAVSQKINVDGSVNIAKMCGKIGAKMIFCSSDQVYFGSMKMNPHMETEELFPKNTYGKQKLEAEQKITQYCDKTISLRLSWMYDTVYKDGMEHSNLFHNIREAIAQKKTVLLPVHDKRSITDVWDVITNIEKFFEVPEGIYNCGSENKTGTYDLVSEIFGKEVIRPNKDAFIDHPRNLMMDSGKAQRYGIIFPSSLESLRESAKRLRKEIEDEEM